MSIAIQPGEAIGPEAARQFRAIYEASFPPAERDDPISLLASIASGERTCHLAVDEADVVGFAVALPLKDVPAFFLEYLAVEPTNRNQGIGQLLLHHVRSRLAEHDGKIAGAIFEVERPEDAIVEEQDLRRRRIGFYLRNGAFVVGCADRYRAPRLDDHGTLAFQLMWLPVVGNTSSAPKGELLRRCVSAILTQSYGLDATDPLVRSNLEALSC